MAKTSARYSPAVRARAVRMVLDHEADSPSQWAAICSIAIEDRVLALRKPKWDPRPDFLSRRTGYHRLTSNRAMRLRIQRFLALLVLGLSWGGYGTASATAVVENCGFHFEKFVCSYPVTYEIAVPSAERSGKPLPYVVIFHDAGESGGALLDDVVLAEWFLESGYAVIAPNAAVRENRRLHYGSNRPGGAAAGDRLLDAIYSEKKFVLETADGSIRDLKWGEDTGWYFYTTDRMTYRGGSYDEPRDYDYIGRDEIQALREIIGSARDSYELAERPGLVLGVGHGGSLAWQFACYAPDLADLYVSFGGAFWREVPEDCRPGARLAHFHDRTSEFWPLDGDPGHDREFERTEIRKNLEMLVQVNRCGSAVEIVGRAKDSATITRWDRCARGGPIELVLTDGEARSSAWRALEVMSRLQPPDGLSLEPEAKDPDAIGPATHRPGEAERETEKGGASFRKPVRGSNEKPESGPAFKEPDADKGSRFKRPY